MTATAEDIPDRSENKNGVILWIVLGASIILLTLVRTLPWFPRVIPVSEDDSWDLALNLFTARHALAGIDYIFTFGPLGFLYNKTYFPETYSLKLILDSIFCSATTLVMVLQARRLFKNIFAALLWVFALVALYGFFGDVFFLAIPVLLVNQYFLLDREHASKSAERHLPLETAILVALLALTAIVKFTFFVAAVWVIAFVALDQLLKKQIPYWLILFVSVYLGSWLLCDQPLSSIPVYITTSLAVASGHSEAMTQAEGNWQLPIFATIISVSLITLSFTYEAWKRQGKAFPVAVLAESGLFF